MFWEIYLPPSPSVSPPGLASPPALRAQPSPRLPWLFRGPPQSASLPAGPALGFTCCLFSSRTGPLTLPPLYILTHALGYPAPTCLLPGRVARCGTELWGAGSWTPARGHPPLPPPPGLYRNVPPEIPGAGTVIRMLISSSPRLGKVYQAPATSTHHIPGCWTWATSFCQHNVDRMGEGTGSQDEDI